jgi:hypothetical protein
LNTGLPGFESTGEEVVEPLELKVLFRPGQRQGRLCLALRTISSEFGSLVEKRFAIRASSGYSVENK